MTNRVLFAALACGGNQIDCDGPRDAKGNITEYTKWEHDNIEELPDGPTPTGGKLQDSHFSKEGGKCRQQVTWGHYEKNAQGNYQYKTDSKEPAKEIDCAKSPSDVKAPIPQGGGGGAAVAQTTGQPGFMSEEWTLAADGALAPTWRYTLKNLGDINANGEHVGWSLQITVGDVIIVNGAGFTSATVIAPANSATNGGWVVDSVTASVVTYRATASRTFNVGQSLAGFRLVSSVAPGQVPWSYFRGNTNVTTATTFAPGGVPLPAPVSNLVAQSADRSVHLTWTHTPGEAHHGYGVYRREGVIGGVPSWYQLHVPLVTAKTYTDTTYACPWTDGAQSYFVEVKSDAGWSDPSATVTAAPVCNMFLRGDADASGFINVTDCTHIWNWLFQGGPEPPCMEAADADDDGQVDVNDGSYLCEWLFRGGPEPPAPGPFSCGFEPTGTTYLGCLSYSACP